MGMPNSVSVIVRRSLHAAHWWSLDVADSGLRNRAIGKLWPADTDIDGRSPDSSRVRNAVTEELCRG